MKTFIANKIHGNKLESKYDFFKDNAFENIDCKTAAIVSRYKCVNESHWQSSKRNVAVEYFLAIRRFNMMTSSNGNIFSVTGRLCGNSPDTGEFPHKGQWRGALMLSLICAWKTVSVNNSDTGDLMSYCAHYDVTVMFPAYAMPVSVW